MTAGLEGDDHRRTAGVDAGSSSRCEARGLCMGSAVFSVPTFGNFEILGDEKCAYWRIGRDPTQPSTSQLKGDSHQNFRVLGIHRIHMVHRVQQVSGGRIGV